MFLSKKKLPEHSSTDIPEVRHGKKAAIFILMSRALIRIPRLLLLYRPTPPLSTKLRKFNELKSVYRTNSVGGRHESSAEHSWSCLILADYFLNLTKKKIDRLKVYDILIYHDVVEIETGDVNINDVEKHKKKKSI